jgi:hypothetical protein
VVFVEQVLPDLADGDGGCGGEKSIDVWFEPLQAGAFAGGVFLAGGWVW